MHSAIVVPASRICASLLIALTTLPIQAAATGECASRKDWAMSLRVDNDLFGGRDQDQGYSNGLQISTVSPNIAEDKDDPCSPIIARSLNHYLDWLQPGRYDQRNMVVSLQHALYTPTDKQPAKQMPDDRPYAAALLLSVGYNAREGDHLRAGHLRVGLVGPAALGHQVQSAAHKLMGVERFNGWNNQLRNEPVFQLVHERMWRRLLTGTPSTLGQDVIFHGGGALGNLGAYANAGLEWRWGWKLPDDFGSAPLRPAGANAAPGPDAAWKREWSSHLFVNLDTRWMLRDITLDGNTFRSSHRVDKKPWVTDLGYGVVVNYGEWRLAFAHYLRSREFYGQRERPAYGSFSISRRF